MFNITPTAIQIYVNIAIIQVHVWYHFVKNWIGTRRLFLQITSGALKRAEDGSSVNPPATWNVTRNRMCIFLLPLLPPPIRKESRVSSRRSKFDRLPSARSRYVSDVMRANLDYRVREYEWIGNPLVRDRTCASSSIMWSCDECNNSDAVTQERILLHAHCYSQSLGKRDCSFNLSLDRSFSISASHCENRFSNNDRVKWHPQ